jgi:hypothetical protein
MAISARTDGNGAPVTSAEEVRRLAGPLNDDAVAEILRVGASREELEIAARYAQGDGDLLDRAGHPLSGRAAQLYEILRDEEADEEDFAAPP